MSLIHVLKVFLIFFQVSDDLPKIRHYVKWLLILCALETHLCFAHASPNISFRDLVLKENFKTQ